MDSALLFTNLADHLLFGALGILLSVYALYVELQKERNPNYVALCDINEQMSCSRVLTSEYVQFFFCNGSWIITPSWCQFKCVFIQKMPKFFEFHQIYRQLAKCGVSLRYPFTRESYIFVSWSSTDLYHGVWIHNKLLFISLSILYLWFLCLFFDWYKSYLW